MSRVQSPRDETLLQGIVDLGLAEGDYWSNDTSHTFGVAKSTDDQLQCFLRETLPDHRFTSGQFLSGFKSKTMEANDAIYEVAKRIRADDSLWELVMTTPASRLQDALEQHPASGPALQAIHDYLAIFGHQGYTLVLVAVPIGSLSLAPKGGDHEARFRVWVQLIDGKGRTSEVTEHAVPVLVQAGELDEARQRSWPFVFEVVTGPGPHRVAVGVRDDLAATTSVVAFDLDAGNAPTASDAVTEAPPLPHTPERWLAEAAAHYQRSDLEQMASAARRALEGLPHGLTESAVAAARRSVFRPAMENGEPVGATYETAARFALDGSP